jgi:hypothetical protein
MSRAVAPNVGRMFDLPYSLCDRLSRLIPLEGLARNVGWRVRPDDALLEGLRTYMSILKVR